MLSAFSNKNTEQTHYDMLGQVNKKSKMTLRNIEISTNLRATRQLVNKNVRIRFFTTYSIRVMATSILNHKLLTI